VSARKTKAFELLQRDVGDPGTASIASSLNAKGCAAVGQKLTLLKDRKLMTREGFSAN
jgi:hypothetical protein